MGVVATGSHSAVDLTIIIDARHVCMDQRPQHARANANPVYVGDRVATLSESNVDLISPRSLLQTDSSSSAPREAHESTSVPRDDLKTNDFGARGSLSHGSVAGDADNDQGVQSLAIKVDWH
ncbi:hypothetical protein V6N13_100034 [Hibiscus sabdariffa]